MNSTRRPLVLASASPRRHELLRAFGLPFDVRPADVDERSSERDPVRLAEGLALLKAHSVVAEAGQTVIGADTVVVLDGDVLGKPADPKEATAMLLALRGRSHLVVTGLAVVAERTVVDHARVAVTMRGYSDQEVAQYIESGGPFDKAGAYAIQDADFAPVERYEGCECAVIGLPLWTLRRLLRLAAGIEAAEPPYPRCAVCPLRGASA